MEKVKHAQRSVPVAAAARLMDCSHNTVRRCIQRGELEASHYGPRRPYKIVFSSLMAFLERSRSRPC